MHLSVNEFARDTVCPASLASGRGVHPLMQRTDVPRRSRASFAKLMAAWK